MSNIEDYLTEIKTILDPIVFDSTTLGTAGTISKYRTSLNDKPNTKIFIYAGGINSRMRESHLQEVERQIIIQVLCNIEGRLNEAEKDLVYLQEEILIKLENNLNNATWGDGYLELNELTFTVPSFNDYFQNYISSSLVINVKKFRERSF